MNYTVDTGHQHRPQEAASTGTDARACMLAEIAFKWLMAGQGCWIDTTRLHNDPLYAAGLLRMALASHNLALRECAEVLQAQMAGPAAAR